MNFDKATRIKPLIIAAPGADYTEANTESSITQIEKYCPDVIELMVKEKDSEIILVRDDLKTTRLMDILKSLKDKRYYFGINAEYLSSLESIHKLMSEVKFTENIENVFFTGLTLNNLEKCDENLEDFNFVGEIVQREIDLPKLYFDDYSMELLTRVKKSGAFGLIMDFKMITRNIMELTRDINLKVFVRTVNNDMDIRHMVDLGVDGIISKNLKQLCDVIDNKDRKYILA